jgi:hypothetical protein
MQQKITLQTTDMYVAEILEATGISQLPEYDQQEAKGRIRAMFEKSIAASVLGFLSEEEKQTLVRLSKEGGEQTLSFLASITSPALELALFSGLEKAKQDFMDHFYQQIT